MDYLIDPYRHRPVFTTRFSSYLYPVSEADSLNVALGFVSGQMYAWPAEAIAMNHNMVGGTLTIVQITHPVPPAESISLNHNMTGGTLTTVQITHPVPPAESIAMNHNMTGGTLTTVQINYTAPTESLDFTLGFVSGVLT